MYKVVCAVICACVSLFVALLAVFGLYYSFHAVEKYQYDNNVTGICNQSGVTHCGSCGECSNSVDYTVYSNMANTLTDKARSCAVAIEGPKKCFDDNIGLTAGCRDCWLENIKCTTSNCFMLCIWETIFNLPNCNDNKLSKCFACDEFHCSSAFLSCAGMSRRRAGVITDICRESAEICSA